MPTRLNPESDRSALGLVAWLESTRVRLPLKGIECRFEVTGGVASVELDQIFHQDNAQPLDCTYSFPLPAGAAVFRCEMHINGRVIRARVEEQEAARKIFAERKAAGQRAALVETERDNLFTLSLGNVQPQDLVVIRFAFFQKLDRLNGELSLRIPLCPGVRYIPGKPLLRSPLGRGIAEDTDETPDASRISPPRIDALHSDAAYFFVRGHIAASDAEAGSIGSPSHPLVSRLQTKGYAVELASHDAVPDRDLVMRWREPRESALKPRAWCATHENESFALVELRAPQDLPTLNDAEGQDFYFLVDRSGSMQGAKWQQTCAGLHAFVGLLGLKDRVSLTLFESTHADFAEGPLPAAALKADPRFRKIVDLTVDGGTNLLPALQHVLALVAQHTSAKQRSARLVLITDGQVGNEAAIIEEMQRQPGLPMDVLGIDTAVNDAFLQTLGRVTNGGCTLQTPADDIAATVKNLGARLHRPVLTHLVPVGDWEPAAERPINLYAADTVTLSLRSRTAIAGPIILRGKRSDGAEEVFELIPEAASEAEAIPLLWAREKITAALDRGERATAIELACRYTLLCKGAAFVAWDKQERVSVAEETLYQPSQEPMYAASPISCGVTSEFSPIEAFAPSTLNKVLPRGFSSESGKKSPGPGSTPGWTKILMILGCPHALIAELLQWLASFSAAVQARLRRIVLQQEVNFKPSPESDRSPENIGKLLTTAVEKTLPPGTKRTTAIEKLNKILSEKSVDSPPV